MIRTVQKEGSNKGRDFYCCQKPREEQCGYFQWVDQFGGDAGGGGGRGRGAGGVRGRGGVKKKASEAGGEAQGGKKQRKCGLCHETGHVRTKCPMKD